MSGCVPGKLYLNDPLSKICNKGGLGLISGVGPDTCNNKFDPLGICTVGHALKLTSDDSVLGKTAITELVSKMPRVTAATVKQQCD